MFKKFLKAFIEFWNYHAEDHTTTLDILNIYLSVTLLTLFYNRNNK